MYNYIGDKMIYILVVIFLMLLFIYINYNSDRKKFKSIDFKSKKLYLCVIFLYGNCGLKTNKAVLSRNNNEFLLETEDNNSVVQSFKFNKDDIVDITIQERLSTKSGESLWNNFTTGDTIGHNTTFTAEKTMKFKKGYDITIMLINDIKIHIQSNKSPYFLFD